MENPLRGVGGGQFEKFGDSNGIIFFYIVGPVRAKFFRGVSSFGPFVLFFAAVNFYFFAASLVWIWFTSILLLRIQFTSIFFAAGQVWVRFTNFFVAGQVWLISTFLLWVGLTTISMFLVGFVSS